MTLCSRKGYLSAFILSLIIVFSPVTRSFAQFEWDDYYYIKISEVYAAGGEVGAPYSHDFVELYNPLNYDRDISTWSLQVASDQGSVWTVIPLTGVIKAKSFYLIQLGSSGNNGVTLPTPDVTN